MIYAIRGNVRLGLTFEREDQKPQDEKEKMNLITSELGADLVTVIHGMVDTLGEERAMKVYTEAMSIYVDEVKAIQHE